VKLTHLGLDADRDACVQDVLALARKAEQARSFLWIDMEESRYSSATLDVYRRAKAEWSNVGVCLQAYLRRTGGSRVAARAVARDSPGQGSVQRAGERRLPKEARRPMQPTSSSPSACSRRPGGKRVKAVFGTHDLDMIGRIRQAAVAQRLDPSAYEFSTCSMGSAAAEQRSHGIASRPGAGADQLRQRLVSPGTCGGLPNALRNVWFVLRNVV